MSDEMHVVSSVPSQELEQNVTDWLVPYERKTDRDRQTDRQVETERLNPRRRIIRLLRMDALNHI